MRISLYLQVLGGSYIFYGIGNFSSCLLCEPALLVLLHAALGAVEARIMIEPCARAEDAFLPRLIITRPQEELWII